MNRRFVQIAILFLAGGFASVQAHVVVESFAVVSSDPQENLFSSIRSPTGPGLLAGQGAVQEWPVTINLARLQTLPERVILNLPNQLPDTLTKLRSAPRGSTGFMWTGGGEGCSALLSAIPNKFRATISCLSGIYRVETTPTGTRLTRYVFASAPPGAENDLAALSSPPEGPASPATAAPGSLNTPESLDTVIDVLILYTANVRQALQASGIDVQQYMQDTLDSTQMAMDRSTTPGQPVIAQLRLARAQEVARLESQELSVELDYLRLDAIPVGLRNTWSADLVMLIREVSPNPNICGWAYGPGIGFVPPPGSGFAPYAVAVTKRECGFSGFPFQHEFGHLFGANHNPENNTNPTPLRPWAFAHWANRNLEDSARTLVAYKHEDCNGVCPQVLNYSNAAITLTKPFVFNTGLANVRENARVIAEYASVTAQYRSGLDRIFASGFE